MFKIFSPQDIFSFYSIYHESYITVMLKILGANKIGNIFKDTI